MDSKRVKSFLELKRLVRNIKIQCIKDGSDEPLFRYYVNGLEQPKEEIRDENLGFELDEDDEFTLTWI